MINKLRIIFILILCSLFGNSSAFAFDAKLIHQYTFSDLWSSTNDVKDSAGNSVGASDGRVFGGATRIIDDNFLGLTATCSVADFNNGYILLDNLGLDKTDGAKTSVTFWLKWGGNVDDEDNRQMPVAWSTYDLLFRGNDFGFNSFKVSDSADKILGVNSNSDLNKNGNNEWVHIAAVFTNKSTRNNKLYINGVKQSLKQIKNKNLASEVSIISNELTIGRHKSNSLKEDTLKNGHSINGRIGNVRIYEGEITQDQVTDDRANINDACSSNTPVPENEPPVLDMRFDEESWLDSDDDNINNAVIDSENGFHGTAFGEAKPIEGLSCNAVDLSTTGTKDYISVKSEAINGLTDFSVVFWGKQNIDEKHGMAPISGANKDEADEMLLYFRSTSEIEVHINDIKEKIKYEADNDWHQFVWTRNASTKENCMYRDGVQLGCVDLKKSTSDPLEISLGGFIIGQDQDKVGGKFRSNQAWDGLIDELLIFSSVLTQEQINIYRQYALEKKDWKGDPKSCSPIILSEPPVLDMRFDEDLWNGNNTVIDSSGNDFHGTAFGATPIEGLSCNAVDLSATGIEDYVSVDYRAINKLADFSVVFWGKQNSNADHIMTPISGFHNNVQDALLLSFTADSNNSIYKIRSTLSGSRATDVDYDYDTDWNQYVWTRDSSTKQSCIYQNGTLLNCQELGSGEALNISSSGFILGQNQNQKRQGNQLSNIFADKQGWDGLIDELLIFPSVLTLDQIQLYRQFAIDGKDWQGIIKPCAGNNVDHYRFELPSSGLTCAPSDIKIKACEDEFCSTLSPEISALTLSPSGQWSGDNVTGNVVSFIENTDTGGVGLSHSIAESISISASNLNPIPTSNNPIQCFVGTTPASCEITFKDAGFLFSTTAGGVIPTQISNKPSSQEFNARTLTIQAVEKDTTTGACQAVFPANTDVDIELKLNCASGECGDINVTTGSSTNEKSIGSSYTTVPFKFGADSLATYEFTYPNAGEMSFSAQKTDALPSGVTLTGSSNNFVVKPFGFKFEFESADAANVLFNGDFGSTTSVFKKAGEEFSVKAIGIRWQAGEDLNGNTDIYDGNISVNFDGSDNDAVEFFSGETVKLSGELLLPATSTAGGLTATNRDLSGSSANFTDAKWSEVGVISLTASLADSDYLGAGNVSGTVTNVGRFTPHHFDYSGVMAGELTGQCTNQTFVGELTSGGLGALTYGGQNPSMTLIAKNLDGNTTVNYRDDFSRFGTATATFGSLVHIDDSSISSPSLITLTGVNSVGTVEPKTSNYGQFIYTAPDSDRFVYIRDEKSLVAPFPANIQYEIKTLVDMDGIGLDSGALPMLSAISSAAHQMVYGRVTLNNTFGPETETLAMPIRHEFFDGQNFVINENIGISCAQPVFPKTDFTLSPMVLGDLKQDALVQSLPWLAGEGSLLIPPSNAQGDVGIQLTVPAWLMFDWDNDTTTIDSNPTATATFGRYRGNDRIINWRENR